MKKTKSTPKRTIKRITDKQYVVYRSPRTGKIVKYRKDRRFIAEVRNKSSHRVVGYLNKILKKGKKRTVLARKIPRLERALKTSKRIPGPPKEEKGSFKINFKDFWMEQIARNGRRAINDLIETVEIDGDALLSIEVRTSKSQEHFVSVPTMRNETDFDFYVRWIFAESINMVRSETIRTSPRQFSKSTRKSRLWAIIKLRY